MRSYRTVKSSLAAEYWSGWRCFEARLISFARITIPYGAGSEEYHCNDIDLCALEDAFEFVDAMPKARNDYGHQY